MTSRDGLATRAARHRVTGLHLEHQLDLVAPRHREKAETGRAGQKIKAVAAVERTGKGPLTLGQRRGPCCEQR